MRLFTRIRDLLQASINDMIDGLEDPRSMINQLIRDLEASILESRQQLQAAVAQQKVVAHRRERADREITTWQENAELAVKQERDDLAREALRRKHQAEDDREALDLQAESAAAQVKELRQQLDLLADKIQEARRKRDTLATCVRQKPPAGGRQIIAGFEAFDELEERMVRQQAATDPDLQTQFDTLRRQAALDAELAALKANQKNP